MPETKLAHPPARADQFSWRSHWALDPDITFLNHGSFGATPRCVLDAQTRWREQIERRPIEMLGRRCAELLGPSREAVARLVGADPSDVAFMTNATEAINAVVRSMALRPGDELLTTTHVYNAVRKTLKYVAAGAGARVIEADVPLPVADPGQIVEVIRAALSARTRLVVIDHVTSPTAVVFPVREIAAVCRERGVPVLVDGAHGPGMVAVDVMELGVNFYAANLHKWICAPKGAAFLWVQRGSQRGVHPTIISHFLGEGFEREFGWTGTRDITPWICVKDAIEFLERLDREIGERQVGSAVGGASETLPAGFAVHGASETHPTGSAMRGASRTHPAGATAGLRFLRHRNHELATWVQQTLAGMWEVTPTTPLDGSMIGSMTTVALPEALRTRFAKWEDVQAALYERHRIEVPGVDWSGRWWVRPCCQLYNVPEEYERLGRAVLDV